jgi:sterol desaturase/sphingolipid hydroxylase (fatty acid hydroxylase superfamily)
MVLSLGRHRRWDVQADDRVMSLTPAQVIVLATPVFLGLIAIEFLVGWRRGRNTYRLADAFNSIGLGMMSQVVGLFTKLAAVGIYTVVYERAALFELPVDAAWVWVVGLVAYDFCYYWLHRLGHTMALLWAAHSVHHQSEDYNLSTALRQTSSGWIAGWVFYLPMALAGIPPLVFGTVALIDLLYQYWVHTQQIGRLGWFDRWFCSPSNHRVHHAVNEKYLDKNYGGILIVWDRMFGTFVEEDDAEPCVYGTIKPLRSWNPLWANLSFYAELARDSWHTRRWRDKLKRWIAPPGWRPADVAAMFPPEPFDLRRVPYGPELTTGRLAAAAGVFLAAMAGTLALLWWAHALSPIALVVGAGGVLALLTAVGWLSTPPGRPQAMAQAGLRAG